MATGDQQDIVARLRALLPRWFGDNPPLLTGLLQGFAAAYSYVYSLIAYARLQTRISTASGSWLDLIAADFFGSAVTRALGQGDAAFFARIRISLFRERATRNAVVKILQDLTGRAPVIFEPGRPTDTGAYAGNEALTLASAPQIYKTDWQGRQLQYPAPRTNYAFQSQVIHGAPWVLTNTSIIPNTLVAPDGSPTGDTLADNAANSYHTVSQTSVLNGAVGQVWTISVFFKAGTSSFAWIGEAVSAWDRIMFDLTAGAVVGSGVNGATISAGVASAPNGWLRCWIKWVCPPGQTRIDPYFGIGKNSTTFDYAGTGNGTIGIWGAQCEQNALTGYIQTAVAPATITDYSIDSTGRVTFASPPAAGSLLAWSGAAYSAMLGENIAAADQPFGVGDGATRSWQITRPYQCGLAYDMLGRYGSVGMPMQALITAFRPQGAGIPNIGGYGAALGYGQGASGMWANLGMVQNAIADADIYAAIDSVRPAASVLWTKIVSYQPDKLDYTFVLDQSALSAPAVDVLDTSFVLDQSALEAAPPSYLDQNFKLDASELS